MSDAPTRWPTSAGSGSPATARTCASPNPLQHGPNPLQHGPDPQCGWWFQVRLTEGHNVQGAQQPGMLHIGASEPVRL